MITLTAYKDVKFTKNHLIESLGTYLSSKEYKVFTDSEGNATSTYQLAGCKELESNKTSFSIRIDLSFNKSSVLARNINYVKLEGSGNSKYYFVTGATYVSEYVTDLQLELDVVNTYGSMIPYTTFNNVKMSRRMKDRWKLYNSTYYRIYDKCDEGLGDVASQVEFNDKLPTTECYIVTRQINDDTKHHMESAKLINEVYFNDTTEHNWYGYKTNMISMTPYVAGLANGAVWSLFKSDTEDGLISCNIDIKSTTNINIIANAFFLGNFYYKDGSTTKSMMMVYLGHIQGDKFVPTNQYRLASITTEATTVTISEAYGTNSFIAYYAPKGQTSKSAMWELDLDTAYSTDELFTNCEPTGITNFRYNGMATFDSIHRVNRTDSSIKQITSVPFTPSSITMLKTFDATYYVTNEMAIDTCKLDLNVSSTEPRHYTKSLNKIVTTRKKVNESKLYGSYVRNHQIVYDTFALPVQPEYYNGYIQSISTTLYKPIDMTNDLAFRCDSLIQQSLNSNVLACSRNNNLTTWSNEYLEYIRNGYNYDEKAQSMNKIKTAISMASSLTGLGMSAINKKSMGALGTFGLIQSATSGITTISSGIISNLENDRALENKRNNLINASPTMSGSGNVNLFKKINDGNCLRYVTTRPSDVVLESIYNLFYFYGYADNTTVDTLKLTKTREYFDYYQGDATNAICTNVRATDGRQALELIKQALSEGITIEHLYNNTWLCEGTLYENWETSI